jgi:phytoene synthase
VIDPAAACREVVRNSRSNFTLAFRFLPRRQRLATNALYAFCRRTDDIADSGESPEEKRRALAAWRAELTDRGRDPIVRGMIAAAAEFNLDPRHLHAVIDGCEMDLTRDRYETFADLALYCSRVAAAVGHLCLGIWGVHGARADQCAEDLGLAVQLTNILRDVGGDAEAGRIYLPLELLGRHHVAESDVLEGRMTAGLGSALREVAARAHEAYARADLRAFSRAERRRLWPAQIITRIYQRLLRQIEEQEFPVLERRVRVSRKRKGFIAAHVLLRRLLP